ncbi:glycosyltransferase family 4 protein [Cloacibacterium normanense]|uniref:glycosyltransferase family 4 protein n=1 Tax=Cloacibacterium normanense TaxID=237258 RepID=UPI0035B4228E
MKILIPILGTFGKAGGWRVLSQLANYWLKEGHDVSFLVHKSSANPYFPTAAGLIYYDNEGKISSAPDTSESLPKFGAIILRSALRKAVDKVSADVLLANQSFTALPVAKSKNPARKFYYIQAYEPDYYYKQNVKDFIYKNISRSSYKLPLEKIVNSPMYLNYKEIQTDKFVFPGLDLDVFKPVKHMTKSDIYILGTIGRLEEYKGTSYIVESFKNLRAELGNSIELHIAFGDPSLTQIDGIKIFNPRGDEELAAYYNSLDAYICAGTIQLGAVHYPVIEAMACKIPVITTGYLPADSTNAWIIPVRDSEAITKAVKKVKEEDVEEKVEKAYHDIQIFRWEQVAAKMLNYFSTKVK